MAETSKHQKAKLANSRKRFKELQELRKKRNDIQIAPEMYTDGDFTPPDNSMNSSHSSANNELIQEDSREANSPPLDKCDDIIAHPKSQESAIVVDSFPDCSPLNKNSAYFEHDSNSTVCSDRNVISISSTLENWKNDNSYEKNNVDLNVDVLHIGETKLDPNNIFISKIDTDSQFLPKNEATISETIQTFKNTNVETAKEDVTHFLNQTKEKIWDSNIENLQELSNQMTQFVDSEYCTSNSITDLEKRNLELMAHLEQEKIISEQQRSAISNLQMKVRCLEKELDEKGEFSNTQVVSEVNKLKEELQCQFQTIGMLIAEKTELSASLSQFESYSKQKSSECEELKARLKTSRSRVADLEREINNLKLEKKQNDTVSTEQLRLIDNLQQTCNNLKDEKEELIQDMIEVREKLRNSSEEITVLQQQIKELSGKLSLANIRIQQLNNEDTQEGGLETLIKEKFELEKQVIELNQILKTMTKERDESSLHYQQYAQQQNTQLINISSRMEQLQKDNENLLQQERDRIKHISELEKQLQSLQTDQVKFIVNKNSDLEVTTEMYTQLQNEKSVIEEKYISVTNEKEKLSQELKTKNDIILHLEDLIEQLRGNQPDSAKLLAVIENDKVAAAKAIQQNRELKQKLESMEEVFLKANNDKVELTEQLSKEINGRKELLEKLQKTELQLQKLTDAIEIKDRELFYLQEKLAKDSKPDLQNEQIAAILHDETCNTSSGAILHELTEAKQMIIKLTDNMDEEKLSKNLDDMSLQKIADNLETSGSKDNSNTQNNSNERNLLNKEVAMKYLEEKFNRTMQETVDLMEEKQRLEHLVTQLQGETETIGEYIALYQQQRMTLKQKFLEKDEQLKQLSHDRECMNMQLERLIELFEKLISDIDTSVQSKSIEEILAVLSEIKSSNMIHCDKNIHHCSWCSGRLITV